MNEAYGRQIGEECVEVLEIWGVEELQGNRGGGKHMGKIEKFEDIKA